MIKIASFPTIAAGLSSPAAFPPRQRRQDQTGLGFPDMGRTAAGAHSTRRAGLLPLRSPRPPPAARSTCSIRPAARRTGGTHRRAQQGHGEQ
jgi:hypothetical protein